VWQILGAATGESDFKFHHQDSQDSDSWQLYLKAFVAHCSEK
jgi:hypothetical protein